MVTPLSPAMIAPPDDAEVANVACDDVPPDKEEVPTNACDDIPSDKKEVATVACDDVVTAAADDNDEPNVIDKPDDIIFSRM